MQFTNKSFEEILAAMLTRISNNILKIEGSIAYDALSPSALKLAEVYENLNFVIDQMSVETASAPYLDRLCEQMGIWRKIATYAVRRASFYDNEDELMDVAVGDRFSLDDINFVVEERDDDGTYHLMAEEPGQAGNVPIGEMQPLQVIEGLEKAVLSEVITAGEDEETDDNLRQRYLRTLKLDAQNGNAAQYQEWLEEYTGVGRYKVTPCWNGVNTVKLCVLNSSNEAASASLLAELQEYFDPNSAGLGNGVAPIGAKVTVTTASVKTINVTAQVTLSAGYSLADVKENIRTALKDFFDETAFEKDSVFYLDVGATILNSEGVESVSSATLNGSTANVSLGAEQIGKLGTLTVTGS